MMENNMALELCKWEVGACSETGYVRTENEDRMSSIRIGQDRLYLVADGMGGHNAGALAAKLTIQGLEAGIAKFLTERSVKETIAEAFASTNQMVYAEAHSENTAISGMGSTAVMLLTQGSLAYIAHVGDSRAYLFTKGKLKQLTKDHSVVERMVSAGMLTPTEARSHPQANVIDRAIGHKPQVEVEIAEPFNLAEGDGVLLCSDGLTGYVDDRDIEAVLRCPLTAQAMANKLVHDALKAGSEDNITVQFIRRNHAGSQIKKKTALWQKKFLPFQVIAAFIIAYGAFFLFKTPSTIKADVAMVKSSPHSAQEQDYSALIKKLEETQSELRTLTSSIENQKQTSANTQDAMRQEIATLQRQLLTLLRRLAVSTKHQQVKAHSAAHATTHKQPVTAINSSTKGISPQNRQKNTN
jgi:protein phosphatase